MSQSKHGLFTALLTMIAAIVISCLSIVVNTQVALADNKGIEIPSTAVDVGNSLHDTRIVLSPTGFNSEVNMNEDGAVIGNRLHLFHLGTSPKIEVNWDGGNGGYTLRSYKNFTETWPSAYVWDVDDRSSSAGAVLHVWFHYSDNLFQNFRFYQEQDGTYYIVNVGSNKFVGLQNPTSDSNNNKLVLSNTPVKWDVEILTRPSKVPITRSSYADGHNWMSCLPDNLLLSEVSIPGTHDSGSANALWTASSQTSYSQTQKYFINEQMNVGVRAFDIRLGDSDGVDLDPIVIHGSDFVPCLDNHGQHIRLSRVVNWAKDFLADHPGETMIFCIKRDDGSDREITKSVERFINEYPDLFWDGTKVPTLGEARGKIVLMRRYDLYDNTLPESRFGIDLTNWDEETSKNLNVKKAIRLYGPDYDETEVWVQDRYKVGGEDKLDFVAEALNQAPSLFQEAYQFNYTSCTHPNPLAAARTVNYDLHDNSHFATHSEEFVGIVVMDFIDGNWSRLIYSKNFESEVVPVISFPETAFLTYGESLAEAEWGYLDDKGEIKGAGEANVDGYFEFVEKTIRPTVSRDSEHTEYEIQFVQTFEGGGTQIHHGPKITVKVSPCGIVLRAPSEEMVYGTKSGEVGYINPEDMIGDIVKGGLVRGDDYSDLGIVFYAGNNKNHGITDEANVGYYHVYSKKKFQTPNYVIKIEEEGNSGDSHFIISRRVVHVEWENRGNVIVGDPLTKVTASLSNLAEKDKDQGSGALCEIEEVKYFDNANPPQELDGSVTTYETLGFYNASVVSLKGEEASNYLLADESNKDIRYFVRGDNSDVVFPEKASLVYGQGLDEVVFEGESGEGTFYLRKDDVASASIPHAGEYPLGYRVVYIPAGGGIEESAVNPINLVVSKKPILVKALPTLATYGDVLPAFDFIFDEDQLVTNDDGLDDADSLDVTLGAFDEDGDNLAENDFPDSVNPEYNRTSCGMYQIAIDELNPPSGDYAVQVIPGRYLVSQRLVSFEWSNTDSLVYDGNPVDVGASISNLVPLPGGEDDCALVVEGGDQTDAGAYRAVITELVGSDIDNYYLPEGMALFKDYVIAQAEPALTFPSEAHLVYGQTLAQATIVGDSLSDVPGIFVFGYPGGAPYAGTHQRLMFFIPEDSKNYKRLSQALTVVVAQAEPTYPGSFTVQLAFAETRALSSIELPEGWVWDDPSTTLTEGNQTYPASFHDAQGNYYDITARAIDVQVNVSPPDDESQKENSGTVDADNAQKLAKSGEGVSGILLTVVGIAMVLSFLTIGWVVVRAWRKETGIFSLHK